MEHKIIALETPGLFLNKTRGFLQAQKDGEIIAKVSLDDLAALVVNAHALSYEFADCFVSRAECTYSFVRKKSFASRSRFARG